MIELRRVSKVYKTGTVALDNINLTVEQGEFVFITGASGAGKTSIVKLLLCEEQPSSGDVYVNGKNLRRLTRRQIPKYRRQIGVVFQDFRLIPSMNVFDNVAFAMRAVGRPYREIRRRVAAALEIVELSDKRKALPAQLSGGEQQRVALARAIVNAPKVIIADEPTGNLDGKLSFEMMKMLNYINSTGITVLVVTHAENLVNYFGKRTVVLKHGKVVNDFPAEADSPAQKEIPTMKSSVTDGASLLSRRSTRMTEKKAEEPVQNAVEETPEDSVKESGTPSAEMPGTEEPARETGTEGSEESVPETPEEPAPESGAETPEEPSESGEDAPESAEEPAAGTEERDEP